MDYEKKYRDLVEAVKKLQEANPSDEGIQNWVNDNVPELKESEDERTRKDIIHFVQSRLAGFPECERFVAWLEKQDGQKPKWKQSDDIRFSQLYDFLVNKTPRLQVDCNEYAAWLNSLKQRMQ